MTLFNNISVCYVSETKTSGRQTLPTLLWLPGSTILREFFQCLLLVMLIENHRQSREHQVQFWPQHRAFCKQMQRSNEVNSAHVHTKHTCGLPTLQERKWILEDWVQLHSHSVGRALYCALKRGDFNPTKTLKQHAVFTVAYSLESHGNPSDAFILESVKASDNPGPGVSPSFDIITKKAAEANAEDATTRGFMVAIPSLCESP